LLTGMSLHGMALTEAAEEKWTDAGQLMDRARRSVRRHVAVTLPVLAESEQLIYLQKRYEPEFHHAISLGVAAAKQHDLAELSAGWVLNGKSVGQQALADATLLARDSGDPALADVLKELTSVRKELAALAFKGEADAAKTSEMTRLAAREQELSKKLRVA